MIKIGWFTKLSASEDLRQSTSHETDGKAVTRKGSGIAPASFCLFRHSCFVVVDSNKLIFRKLY